MKFIKKHISVIVAIVVFILVVAGLLLAKELFSTSDSKAIYGNRLEGIDNVKISTEEKNAAKEKLSEGTKSVEVRIAGRIIYIDVTANDDLSLESAKELGNKVLEAFSDKEKEYYDIQIIFSKDTDSNQFPIIGYKHHTKSAISWTKDRAES